jgi:hypothetical protein
MGSGTFSLLVAASMVIFGNTAKADSLVPVSPLGYLQASSSWWDTATGQTPTTVTGDGSNDGTTPVLVNDLTANGASTYNFSNGIAAPLGSYKDVQINDANQGMENIGFVDTYVFAITASTTNAFAFSLNLSSTSGLQDLTARLYEYSANGVQNLTIGGTGPVQTAQTVDNWSLSTNPSGSGIASTSIAASNLGAGEYVLEIAGLEMGTANGAYSGQLGIAPVPLPAGLPLLLSGLAGIGFNILRRKTTAD